ncbi:Uma2 family endonuclease [Dactylosporangium siamense]|uniref:Uma2 family endonuclease n=1 Tax=Dactylosporangium siamense TaxID=685454 RepID=UPI001940DDCA|nr:Uma2 family endonuclease [Dactylosporangium siamense]
MTALPEWMYAPRIEGWHADDLDHLLEAPPHTEMLHGAFVFRLFPPPAGNDRLVDALAHALTGQAPAGVEIARETAIRLDTRNRFESDLLATAVAHDPSRTFFTPEQVLLVVEVVSPESAYRDRMVKPRKYAEAGVAHYWRVEEEDSSPVVHAYELDEPTRQYVPTGIHSGELHTTRPFEITLDLNGLGRPRR